MTHPLGRKTHTADAATALRTAGAAYVVAAATTLASLYGLIAADPYRDVSEATVLAAKAQDVCSLVVAALLVVLARRTAAKVHLVRLGLLAYVAYSYAIYLVGLPMNRIFLVYVVLVSVSGAGLVDGVVRLRPSGWPRTTHRRLERGTGWMLVAIAALFGALWLSVLLPFAFGGEPPSPEGPGGAPYPVFILDLVVVLPCVAAVGSLLLRGSPVSGPLAVVVLIKIITLFTALWAGVIVGLASDAALDLGADAGPSLLMLVASVLVTRQWLRAMSPDKHRYIRPTFWNPSD